MWTYSSSGGVVRLLWLLLLFLSGCIWNTTHLWTNRHRKREIKRDCRTHVCSYQRPSFLLRSQSCPSWTRARRWRSESVSSSSVRRADPSAAAVTLHMQMRSEDTSFSVVMKVSQWWEDLQQVCSTSRGACWLEILSNVRHCDLCYQSTARAVREQSAGVSFIKLITLFWYLSSIGLCWTVLLLNITLQTNAVLRSR